MPALNEEKTVGDVICRIPREIPGIDHVQVVLVNDGSTDTTVATAREADASVIVISHPQPYGVGVAFASGIDAALKHGADVIVNMDSDGQFRPEDIPELVRPILDDGFGFVTCTRFGNPDYVPTMPWVKKWGNRMMCHLVNWVIWGGEFTDVSCGFRAYSRDTALRINLFGRFTYTQESFIDLAGKNVRMTEAPLKVRGVREFGKSRVASNLWNYAFQTFPIIARAMRDIRPLKFFGGLGLIFVLLGLVQVGFVSGWWFVNGVTSPWKSLLTTGSASLVIGMMVGVLALIADQLGRVKKVNEELLRLQRRAYYDGFLESSSSSSTSTSTSSSSSTSSSTQSQAPLEQV